MTERFTNLPSSLVKTPDHSDYLMLISLELDGMLDAEEKGLLDRHLELCSQCRVQWLLWQVIDQRLEAAPVPEPAPGFSHLVAERIARQERLRNIQIGLVLTVLTVLVWALGLVGVCALGGALVYANLDHFSATAQFLSDAWAVAGVVGQSLWGVIVEMMTTTTTLGIASAYLVIVVAALAGWCIFIQRTTQPLRSRIYG
jgi:anti-sigma factor RsiW